MPNPQSVEKQPFAFEPPAGGDITFRSKDGIAFSVHSIILGLVSPVFSDMTTVGKKSGETIDLDDDAESISILLAFVYPSSIWPTIDSVDMLEKCLQIAQKYNIEKIPQALDRDLSLNSSLINSWHSDPLRIFRLAVNHGLRKTQTLAAKAIAPNHIDLRQPSEVVKVAQEYPNAAHVVGLVGAQTIRVVILADILLELHDDLLPKTNLVPGANQKKDFTDAEGGTLMMCNRCIARSSHFWSVNTRPTEYIPSWLHGWTREAYRALSDKPLEHCGFLFTLDALIGLEDYLDVCEGCIEAAKHASFHSFGRPGEVFESWASDVKHLIMRELKKLDPLYSL
ncbi:The BTB (BR-C, ttk and bab)/POZ (Pox virus and Zinc finger) domain [Ceratobasidium sp. AG-Ba]|nr:The BTB (BR-C, ttk and bab)/POZ (Pox virus and Zinc finger) domain [Ceratobasidium sp. AG-Ba]